MGRISRLTTEHIVDRGDTLALKLGRVPVEIPAPLDDLIRRLAERRNGRAATIPIEEPKWLFHSIYPGQPIDPHTLGRRLKAIGVPPQLARHASLMDVASELPAMVISRLLGFHQNTGDNWTRESGLRCRVRRRHHPAVNSRRLPGCEGVIDEHEDLTE